MPSPSRLRLVDPATLPDVWKVSDFAGEDKVVASGHAGLDSQLPGGGWPLGSMVEVLHHAGSHPVWRLVLPALAQVVTQGTGPVVLVGAPHEPYGPSLQAQGLPGHRLLWVRAEAPASRLWACEQALKCADVAAVLAWLPRSKAADLRRLQMAAHASARLFYVFREVAAAQEASPARLRLQVEVGETLAVTLLKRRGPPLESAIHLPAQAPRLAALLETRKNSRLPAAPLAKPRVMAPGRSHVLDRAPAHP